MRFGVEILMSGDVPVLECQSCGKVLRKLSAAEAQMVARDPDVFTVYCSKHAGSEW